MNTHATGLIKRTAAILAALLMLLASSAVSSFAEGNFIIRNFDIRMVVSEDDIYQITETVDVEFTAPSHGIYVIIPSHTVLDRDGQKSEYNAAVRDFKVLSGQPVSESKDAEGYSFKIGDRKSYAETNTTYQYSYVYDTKGDHLKDGDEVYHNLVGTRWEAAGIDRVSFEVVFPKDIEMSKVGIKTGKNVSVPFEAVDSRTIKGETTENVLGGLTLRAVLPQGYFTREAKDPAALFYLLTGILALVAAGGFVLWRRYGKDPVYPETLELYPPEGLTAPEVAYLSGGEITNKEVISILLTLADKGYLKIRELEEETGKKNKTETVYEIEKIREYDDDVIGEKTFMDGLFSKGDTVRVKDLEDKFYNTADEIRKEIEEKYKDRLYDSTAAGKAKIMYIAGWAGLAALFVTARLTGSGMGGGAFKTLLEVVGPTFFVGGGFNTIAEALKNRKKAKAYVTGALFTVFGLLLAIPIAHLMPFLACLAFCLLLFIMGGLCEKKTEWYAEIRARIKGFTDYLETAEKDSMETLAEQDPGYYYRNLAFAFALGVTAVYAKRFGSMAQKAPEWYDSHYYHHHDYSSTGMIDSINRMTDSVSSSMASSPSDGSGGGSFSGGGGGGGSGGGSW